MTAFAKPGEPTPLQLFQELDAEQQQIALQFRYGTPHFRTAMEVFRMLPEGCRAEVIDNILYMPPSPLEDHQGTSMRLSARLFNFLENREGCRVYAAPFDVFLDDTQNAVQPDIFVLLGDNPTVINPKGHIHGVPDLIVEILSQGNASHDLVRKKELYERFGVKEYFIVDPETGLTLHFALREGHYEKVAEHVHKLESALLETTIRW